MSWTKAEETRLKALAKDRSLFASEIAEILGRNPQTVRCKLRTMGFDLAGRAKQSGRLGGWNAKHAHIRVRAMRYFLTHTVEETRDRFQLTASEFKSLQTVAYRDPKCAHLRKDSRRKDPWSFDETMFLLRASGLQPRIWIARKLKRGGVHAVKEMVSRLNSNTRYINGLPKRLAEELVGREVEGFKVKAGPSGRSVDCRPIIVPWVIIYSEARRSKAVPEHILAAVRAMASFQKRVHGTRGIKDTVASVKRIIGRR